MLSRSLFASFALLPLVAGAAAAQDFAPHKAAYSVSTIENGKVNSGSIGTYEGGIDSLRWRKACAWTSKAAAARSRASSSRK